MSIPSRDLPSTNRKWLIKGTKKELEELEFTEGPVPQVSDHDVLVRLHAAALNYRDLMIPRGDHPYELKLPVVGGSDGAGEVIEVGSKVTRWRPGDRVATLFNPGHQSGPIDQHAYKVGGVGGTIDGTFQQYGVFDETWVPLKPGEWVLTQGTGGVSLFAVQFAKAAGARVVATTSSQAKAAVLKELGADHVINYAENKQWGKTARALAPNGRGFEHIVEVGGAQTMAQSIDAVKLEGTITFIGLVTGIDPPDSMGETLKRVFTVRGIHVGSRVLMEDMMDAMKANSIQPVIDKTVFKLEQLKEALQYLKDQKHVGKVAIKIV